MGLTKYEMETIINMNLEDAEMLIYTANPALLRRLEKLPAYTKIKEYKHGGRVIAADFTADKHLLTLRSKRLTVELTDEERELRRERAKAIRAKQLESKTTSRNG